MGRFDTIKTTIDANIKQNGNQEITGQILNSVLNGMMDSAGIELSGLESDIQALQISRQFSYLPHEQGTLPNIDTATGVFTMWGAIVVGNSSYFINDKSCNIKTGTQSGARKIVYNIDSKELRSIPYNTATTTSDIVLGCMRTNYGASWEYLVKAYFPFEFSIDGETVDTKIANLSNEISATNVILQSNEISGNIFSVTAGVNHSSTKDRVDVFIRQGERFIISASCLDGASVSTIKVSVTYTDGSPWAELGEQAVGESVVRTAEKDIKQVGLYLDPSWVTASGKLQFSIFGETIIRAIETSENSFTTSVLPDYYSYEKVMDISTPGQGGCAYGDYFFQGHYATNGSAVISLYNLESKTFVQDITFSGMGVADAHFNTMVFGNKYADSDAFPLIYVSSGYSTDGSTSGISEVYVYRILGEVGSLTASLIQTIQLDGFGWTEAVVDTDNDCIWLKCNGNEYRCYALPDTSTAEVLFSYSNDAPIESFTLPNVVLPNGIVNSSNQAFMFYKGKIWYLSGIPYSQGAGSCYMAVIDVRNRCRESIIWLKDVGLAPADDNSYEPESIFLWNGKLCIANFTFIARIIKDSIL